MNMTDKDKLNFILIVAGIIVFAIGVFLSQDQSFSIIYSIVMILGASAFGHGMGELIQSKLMQSNEDFLKRKDIERTKEQAEFMGMKAKAKTFDVLSKLFPVFMLVLAIMRESFTTIMLLLALYILLWGIFIYKLNRQYKKKKSQ